MYILRAHTPTASSPSVSVYIFLALRALLSELSLATIARVHKERAVCSCVTKGHLNCGVFYALSRLEQTDLSAWAVFEPAEMCEYRM